MILYSTCIRFNNNIDQHLDIMYQINFNENKNKIDTVHEHNYVISRYMNVHEGSFTLTLTFTLIFVLTLTLHVTNPNPECHVKSTIHTCVYEVTCFKISGLKYPWTPCTG